jgi:hypothetical protein
MAGEVASHGISTSSVYMPLVQTKMVESKGHTYDHVSLLTLDMACDLIERAIVTKEAEVTDAPSRFLALMYFFRPSLVVQLNSLVYGLEGECPPDVVSVAIGEAEIKKKQPKAEVSSDGFSVLGSLASLPAFFAWLERFCTRISIAWILRDPLIVVILMLVLVVQPLVAGALTVWHFGRRSLCGRRSQEGGRAPRKHNMGTKPDDERGALAPLKAELQLGSHCSPRVRRSRPAQS